MKIYKLLFIAIALIFVCQAMPVPVSGQGESIIGEGDLLKITVYDNPDLTFETRVSDEGSISFPLIGQVVLKDLTATEAEKKIAGLLADGYIIKPQVFIFIQESKTSFVFVNGEVKNPGSYKITRGMTVLKAITVAGGFTPKAAEGSTRIIRKADKAEGITVKAKMDELVLPDDVIFVPESWF